MIIPNQNKYKTMLCRHFQQGNCSLMEKCHFAHGQHQLRHSEDPVPIFIPPPISKNMAINNFKTQKCKYYQKGYCKNQNNCSFAHGQKQLQSSLNPPIKSENIYNQYISINQQQQMMHNLQQESLQINQKAIKSKNDIIMIKVIQELKNVFEQNKQIQMKLNEAQRMYEEGNGNFGNDIINKIMKDSNIKEEEKESYDIIISNAKTLLAALSNNFVQINHYMNN